MKLFARVGVEAPGDERLALTVAGAVGIATGVALLSGGLVCLLLALGVGPGDVLELRCELA